MSIALLYRQQHDTQQKVFVAIADTLYRDDAIVLFYQQYVGQEVFEYMSGRDYEDLIASVYQKYPTIEAINTLRVPAELSATPNLFNFEDLF